MITRPAIVRMSNSAWAKLSDARRVYEIRVAEKREREALARAYEVDREKQAYEHASDVDTNN